MKQRTTVLVARQDDLSSVYEARKQKITYTMNPATLFTTEKNKFNGWINGIANLIEDQKTQMKKNNDESKTTFLITSFESDRVEITVFLLIHNLTGSANERARPSVAIVPSPTAGGCCYENRGSTHGWKIIANQSESFCENSSTPTKLEDLQWTDRPVDESYRRHFLESFTRFNEVLRARGNYYAARTSRYTTVLSRLTPCIAVPNDKRKRQVVKNPIRSFETMKLKESQTYRIILPEVKLNENSKVFEVENLRKENELLGRALRRAADLHLSMLSEARATLKEKEKLAEERRALKDERSDFQAQREELQRLEESRTIMALKENERLTQERRTMEALRLELRSRKKEFKRLSVKDSGKLREKERHLEETRRDLDLQRQKFAVRKEVFEKFNIANSTFVGEEIVSLEDQRQSLELERQNFAMQKEELARERQIFEERKKMFGSSNEEKASSLRDQERLSAQQRQRLERDKQELAEQRERFRQQETASAAAWREKEASLEEQRRVLERFQEELVATKRSFEEYYENRADNLREREESLKAQRRGFERDQRSLSMREDELQAQQKALRSTPPTVIVQKDDGIKIPIIPEILSWHIKLPW